jgi:hypothetical protein
MERGVAFTAFPEGVVFRAVADVFLDALIISRGRTQRVAVS